ncbi:hypothetical protein D5S17_05875 [Pseudonocardiaceae bacterium YIM PH 21723]|nr:hypothetical protein D5S17_05875 [Pseudonocardiaceae bacterium YIM PH 21723]
MAAFGPIRARQQVCSQRLVLRDHGWQVWATDPTLAGRWGTGMPFAIAHGTVNGFPVTVFDAGHWAVSTYWVVHLPRSLPETEVRDAVVSSCREEFAGHLRGFVRRLAADGFVSWRIQHEDFVYSRRITAGLLRYGGLDAAEVTIVADRLTALLAELTPVVLARFGGPATVELPSAEAAHQARRRRTGLLLLVLGMIAITAVVLGLAWLSPD